MFLKRVAKPPVVKIGIFFSPTRLELPPIGGGTPCASSSLPVKLLMPYSASPLSKQGLV